jgi:hypothetical protein
MKINVKPKIGPTAQFNVRLPLSLKQRLDGLRTRATDSGADFNATLVGVLEEFAVELDTRLGTKRGAASKHPSSLLAEQALQEREQPAETQASADAPRARSESGTRHA